MEKVLNKFNHLEIKEVNTPFDTSIKLLKNNEKVVAQLEYANAIGSQLEYAV